MQTDVLRSRLETTTNLTICRWRTLSTGAEESYRDIPSVRIQHHPVGFASRGELPKEPLVVIRPQENLLPPITAAGNVVLRPRKSNPPRSCHATNMARPPPQDKPYFLFSRSDPVHRLGPKTESPKSHRSLARSGLIGRLRSRNYMRRYLKMC